MIVDELDAKVVQQDVVVADAVPFDTIDTEVTNHSTESSMHTGKGFLEDSLIGRCLLSMLTM